MGGIGSGAVIRHLRAAEQNGRATLAEKIVMAITDKIVADIVRPGPVEEERECYVMAKELRDIGPDLQELVIQILKIERNEQG